jgi:hypothetical protein
MKVTCQGEELGYTTREFYFQIGDTCTLVDVRHYLTLWLKFIMLKLIYPKCKWNYDAIRELSFVYAFCYSFPEDTLSISHWDIK